MHQQLLPLELLLHLPQLHNPHAAAIGGKLQRCMLLQPYKQSLRRRRPERRIQFFFEHRERSLQPLEIHIRSFLLAAAAAHFRC